MVSFWWGGGEKQCHIIICKHNFAFLSWLFIAFDAVIFKEAHNSYSVTENVSPRERVWKMGTRLSINILILIGTGEVNLALITIYHLQLMITTLPCRIISIADKSELHVAFHISNSTERAQYYNHWLVSNNLEWLPLSPYGDWFVTSRLIFH